MKSKLVYLIADDLQQKGSEIGNISKTLSQMTLRGETKDEGKDLIMSMKRFQCTLRIRLSISKLRRFVSFMF